MIPRGAAVTTPFATLPWRRAAEQHGAAPTDQPQQSGGNKNENRDFVHRFRHRSNTHRRCTTRSATVQYDRHGRHDAAECAAQQRDRSGSDHAASHRPDYRVGERRSLTLCAGGAAKLRRFGRPLSPGPAFFCLFSRLFSQTQEKCSHRRGRRYPTCYARRVFASSAVRVV